MRKYNPENQPKAWLFLLPSLGVILLFNIYPLLRSFWMSFQKGSLLKLQYTGLDNYQKVIADPVFHKALLNTALYAFAVVPVALLISVIIAWIIFEKIKRKSFFETNLLHALRYKYNRYRDCVPLLLQWGLRNYQLLPWLDWYSSCELVG